VDIDEKLAELYKSKAFSRRAKKHVRGRQHFLDIVVPPQWIDVCQGEVEALGYGCEKVEYSILRVTGRIWDGYILALNLRTASRVGITIPEFRAPSKVALIKKLQSIPWELWINPKHPIWIYSNVEHSSVRHEGFVSDALFDAVKRCFEKFGFSVKKSDSAFNEKREIEYPRQRLWINLKSNVCLIRIDMVGAHLHQRGYRKFPGKAPMLETLVAAIADLAGWQGNEPLVDGMTGSGTFAIEAAMKSRKIPPGIFRTFLFETWPSFQKKRWDYIKKQTWKEVSDEPSVPLIAVERNVDVLNMAKENASVAGVSENIQWIHGDFFEFSPADFGTPHGLLFLNPPYGKRISTEVAKLYNRIDKHIRKAYSGWKVAIVFPQKNLISKFTSVEITKIRRFPHGGLWIYVVVGRAR